MVNPGIAFEAAADVIFDPMMPPDLGQQFGHEARHTADRCNVTLTPQAS
jgi:hypothetical protein